MKSITIKFGGKAEKELRRLPQTVVKKMHKQLRLLIEDIHYPSLHAKKLQGEYGKWEARIDYHYRFTFIIGGRSITILSIGPHDQGLGKN